MNKKTAFTVRAKLLSKKVITKGKTGTAARVGAYWCLHQSTAFVIIKLQTSSFINYLLWL